MRPPGSFGAGAPRGQRYERAMRWKQKALFMRACAVLPKGETLYRFAQKKVGRLTSNPTARIPDQIKLASWLLENGFKIEGREFLEVGTGHLPILPIGFFLAGAHSVITMDLHRRLDFGLLRESLQYFSEHRSEIQPIYEQLGANSDLDNRFKTIDQLWQSPSSFLEAANILYSAPADATDTRLPAASVDYHFSYTVLEHIPEESLRTLFSEATRILADGGVVVHSVDTSDHFQHTDPTITKINFLQFSDEEWDKIAGNEFCYHNRLRLSDYLTLFEEFFQVVSLETNIDEESVRAVTSGFPLSDRFKRYSLEDICCSSFHIMLRSKKPALR